MSGKRRLEEKKVFSRLRKSQYFTVTLLTAGSLFLSAKTFKSLSSHARPMGLERIWGVASFCKVAECYDNDHL